MEGQGLIWVRVVWVSLFLAPYIDQIPALYIMSVNWIHILHRCKAGSYSNKFVYEVCNLLGPHMDPLSRKHLQQLGEVNTDKCSLLSKDAH